MSSPPRIIVRAFDDEPCALYAVALQAGEQYVNVCRDLPARPVIGWPVYDAFDYSEDDFQQLQEAYSRGDRAALDVLYRELRCRPRQFVEILSAVKQQEQ